VSSFELAEDIVKQNTLNPTGTIRVSSLPSYTNQRLYLIIQQFRTKYPDITIDLHATDQVQDLIRDKIDFAIRPTSNPPEHLVAKVIDNHKMSIVASPEYIERYGTVDNLSDLKKHKSLCYRGANGVLPWFACVGGEWKPIERQPHFTCNDTTELLRLVRHGEGIALLPEWTTSEYVEQQKIHRLDVGLDVSFVSDFDHRLYLIYERKSVDLRRNRLFLNFFMDQLRK
ncbi:MAG: substrate binding domain-containing protein, partial [Pseudomonadota bacterium]